VNAEPPVEPQPVKKIFPPLPGLPRPCRDLPRPTDSANSLVLADHIVIHVEQQIQTAAISWRATSLRFAVTGCEDSVVSAPEFELVGDFRNSWERRSEDALMILWRVMFESSRSWPKSSVTASGRRQLAPDQFEFAQDHLPNGAPPPPDELPEAIRLRP